MLFKVIRTSTGCAPHEVGCEGSIEDCDSFCESMGWFLIEDGRIWYLDVVEA